MTARLAAVQCGGEPATFECKTNRGEPMNKARLYQSLIATCTLLLGTLGHAAEPAELLDRLQIQELQSRYALAHDLTDPDMYAGVFTADAELMSGGKVMAKGRQALHDTATKDRKRFNAGAKDGERSFGKMRHVITNSVIDLQGPAKATGLCYVMTIVMIEGVGPQILGIGRYEDEYSKVDGKWYIARRNIVSDWGNQAVVKASGLF